MIQKDFVKTFGTKVKCGTERYVLELHGLTEPIHFINPRDAGTKYGDQNLKGNGQDILLLNSVSTEQIAKLDAYLQTVENRTNRKAEDMDTSEVKALLSFLEKNGYNDRYCSDLAYKEKALIPTVGRMCRRSNDECRAVVIPKGTVYEDGEKANRRRWMVLCLSSMPKAVRESRMFRRIMNRFMPARKSYRMPMLFDVFK